MNLMTSGRTSLGNRIFTMSLGGEDYETFSKQWFLEDKGAGTPTSDGKGSTSRENTFKQNRAEILIMQLMQRMLLTILFL